MLHRGCEEVLEGFAPETICLGDKRKEHLTTLRGWPAVLGHLGDFSSVGCPTLCLCLMSGEGLATGLGDEDIAKDLLLLDADEEKIWSRAVLGVDSAELAWATKEYTRSSVRDTASPWLECTASGVEGTNSLVNRHLRAICADKTARAKIM